MSPHKLRYRKYKSFEKVWFLKDVSNLPEKKKLYRMEKSVSQSVEQIRSMEIKSNSVNNKPFVTKTL